CFGGSNGSINLTASGGTAPYTYLWTGPGVNASAEDQSGLSSGTYSVTVTDNKGCTFTLSNIQVTQPAAALSASESHVNVSCFGGSNGSINLTPSGGTAPYTYLWTGSGVNASVEDQSGLSSGTYSVTVTDNKGCTFTLSNIQVTQPAAGLSASETHVNVSCFGGSNGSINLTASGGTAPYTYLWTGSGVNASAEDQSGLAAGAYSVLITDANGCTSSANITLTEPTLLENAHTESDFNGYNIACNGGVNGSIDLSVSGGVAPYSYAWSGAGVNASAEDQSGLAAGAYSVLITDANGCTSSANITLTEPALLENAHTESDFNGYNIACNGGANGSIDLSVSGGVAPYSYAWSGAGVNASAEDQSGLAAGAYSVLITDANGCTSSANITLTEPTLLENAHTESDFNGYNLACNGGVNGSIDLSVSGGVAPYSYVWSGAGVNASAEDQSGLAAGAYSVLITDANGCTSSANITLTEPTLLENAHTESDFNGYNIACNGGANGSIALSVSGGVAPYSYAWSGAGVNASAEEQSGLAAGAYSVLITDANGCTSSANITLTEPTELVASKVEGSIACYGGSTSVNIIASGGTPPYTNAGSHTVS
ncbi:SprB repeat-containing protein, partial [Flavobacterium sp. SM15]|uniref:SprB repeat-containing protein n=1 Tax=Flavobacterium sp. SM15 TaxID=2908005 RepID=UPI001EDA6E88